MLFKTTFSVFISACSAVRWYGARCYELIAAIVVLLVLLDIPMIIPAAPRVMLTTELPIWVTTRKTRNKHILPV